VAVAFEAGMPSWLGIPFGLLCGMLLGFVNGILMITLRIPAIIVTLGTMTVYRSLSLVLSNATTVASFPKDNWFFESLGGKLFGVIPASVVIMAVTAVVGYIIYNHTIFGRQVCAIGANAQAAKYSGIKVNAVRLATMMVSGAACGIAAIAILSFLGAADPSVGSGSEMLVISAAIIGGASLSGGSGSILGAVIGALIIAVIRNGLVLLGVSIYWQGFVTGATIIAAVALDYIIKRRRS
jgi:ribose transport system permease protein